MSSTRLVGAAVHVRWMIRRDMPEVLEIERECFGQGAWTREDFIRHLRQRNCIGMVAEHENLLVGYMVYELSRRWMLLVRLAVDPGCRGQGVGTTLLDKLKRKLSAQRRQLIVCPVQETALDTLRFLHRRGFRAIGLARQAELDRRDRIVMVYRQAPGCQA